MELAENCPNLRYVCISNCGHVTDQSLVSLANNCPQLVTLECASVSQLTDAGFQVLVFFIAMKSCHFLGPSSFLPPSWANGSWGVCSYHRHLHIAAIQSLSMSGVSVSFSLWAHHWWGDPSSWHVTLCQWKPYSAWVRQLSSHNRSKPRPSCGVS